MVKSCDAQRTQQLCVYKQVLHRDSNCFWYKQLLHTLSNNSTYPVSKELHLEPNSTIAISNSCKEIPAALDIARVAE